MTLAPRDCIARVDCCGSQPTLHSMLRSMSKQCSINSSVTAHSIIALHDTYKYTCWHTRHKNSTSTWFYRYQYCCCCLNSVVGRGYAALAVCVCGA